jgi:phycoerythrin-associated linker protein
MPFGPASLLGVESFDTDSVVELLPGDDDLRKIEIIRSIYRQVLGNAYVMDSERDLIAESQFKLGELSVREFVRKLVKSDLYRTRFFDSCSRYRYIELSFRHLLGRAPTSYEEMRCHSDTLDQGGFEKDIDTFIDCKEYQDVYGEWVVPYQRGWKTEACGTMQEFTWNFQLLRGNSSSSLKGDLAGKSAKLGGAAYQNRPLPIVRPSSDNSTGWSFRPASNLQGAPTRLGVGAGSEGKTFRVEVTAYKANNLKRISRYVKSNRVYYIPFEKLSEQFIRIHKEGGKISSITPMG